MSIKTFEVQMLIRKSAKTVFNAFIDSKIIAQFWVTQSSGKLEKGKIITWEWEMYNAKVKAEVLEIIPDKKIIIEWGKPKCKVEFTFEIFKSNQTLVKIKCYDFKHKKKNLVPVMLDYAGGFTTVLDNLKAYLEHNIKLKLIEDKFPDKIQGK